MGIKKSPLSSKKIVNKSKKKSNKPVGKAKKSRKGKKTKQKQTFANKFKKMGSNFLKRLLNNKYIQSLIALFVAFLALYGVYCFSIKPYSYRWMPCYGNKSYGVCMPFKYDVHGLDVSRHQGVIEWDTIVSHIDPISPLHFVFIKATEGGDFRDINFKRNFSEAKRVNLIRGAYHFFTPKTSAKKQAEFYIENVKLSSGDLPPVLDVEVLGNHTAQSISDSVKVWLDIVGSHYKTKPILYTSFKFKKRYLSNPYFDAYPFWIAHYYVERVRYTGKWSFWQHSDIGRVNGIYKDVDLNVFNGTIEELKELTLH